jgi:elongation factor Ts
MEIKAADVMKLRERTGAQMMKCKEALIKANGDMEKAIELIRIEFTKTAVKVEEREAGEGRIAIFIDPDAGIGGIVELRCETAPVSKSELFVNLANDLARQVSLTPPANVDDLLKQPYHADTKHKVNDKLTEVVGLMREKLVVARFAAMTGILGEYVHHDATQGVLLEVKGNKSNPALLRDVCMHIVASHPRAALRDEVPKEVIDKELEIARAQAMEQGKGKPANIIEKIAEGKLRTWFEENVLAEQKFVKDPSKTIGQLLKEAGLELVRFARYKVGEKA